MWLGRDIIPDVGTQSGPVYVRNHFGLMCDSVCVCGRAADGVVDAEQAGGADGGRGLPAEEDLQVLRQRQYVQHMQ